MREALEFFFHDGEEVGSFDWILTHVTSDANAVKRRIREMIFNWVMNNELSPTICREIDKERQESEGDSRGTEETWRFSLHSGQTSGSAGWCLRKDGTNRGEDGRRGINQLAKEILKGLAGRYDSYR